MSRRAGLDPGTLAANGQDAVHELYEKESEKLIRRLTRVIGSSEIARELTHEAFVRIVSRSSAELPQIDRPQNYLARIATNLLRDWRRREGRAQFALEYLGLDRAEVDQIARLEARDTLRRLNIALSKMKPKTRDVFLAHRLDGFTYREIADLTGLSVSGVEKQMTKAIVSIDRVLRRR